MRDIIRAVQIGCAVIENYLIRLCKELTHRIKLLTNKDYMIRNSNVRFVALENLTSSEWENLSLDELNSLIYHRIASNNNNTTANSPLVDPDNPKSEHIISGRELDEFINNDANEYRGNADTPAALTDALYDAITRGTTTVATLDLTNEELVAATNTMISTADTSSTWTNTGSPDDILDDIRAAQESLLRGQEVDRRQWTMPTSAYTYYSSTDQLGAIRHTTFPHIGIWPEPVAEEPVEDNFCKDCPKEPYECIGKINHDLCEVGFLKNFGENKGEE